MQWAYELPYTLLSLADYARIMGINPVHFAGAVGSPAFPIKGGCSAVWFRHSWQFADIVSHEELAMTIAQAEEEIANYIGFWPAPNWISHEEHAYPKYFRNEWDSYSLSANGSMKDTHLRYGKLISPGRRKVSKLATATVVYSDPDNDGWDERATVTVTFTVDPADACNSVTKCDVKLYFKDTLGAPEWEIRPIRSRTLVGNVLTIVLDSWLLIDPDILGTYPTQDGPLPVDLSTTTPLVDEVDVYYETVDTAAAPVEFYWHPGICTTCAGSCCSVCRTSTTDGCMVVQNGENSIVEPIPATYGSGIWTIASTSWCCAGEPKGLYAWYLAGEQAETYLSGRTCEPLSLFYAQAIAWLATARLERPLCGCTNVANLSEELQVDLALSGRDFGTHFLSARSLTNPFGTKRGEIMAWRRLDKLVQKRFAVAVV